MTDRVEAEVSLEGIDIAFPGPGARGFPSAPDFPLACD